MPASRDRSVVRSSLSPSAKYCWLGSLLRLVKGSTTIDSRGATRGWGIDVAVAATVAGGDREGLYAVHSHQATTAMTSAAAAAAAIAASALLRRRGDAGGAPPDAKSAAAC